MKIVMDETNVLFRFAHFLIECLWMFFFFLLYMVAFGLKLNELIDISTKCFCLVSLLCFFFSSNCWHVLYFCSARNSGSIAHVIRLFKKLLKASGAGNMKETIATFIYLISLFHASGIRMFEISATKMHTHATTILINCFAHV